MQVLASALTIYLFQLLFFVAAIYLTALLRLRYSFRLSATDVFMLLLQALNLASLPPYVYEHNGLFTTNGGVELLLPVQVAFLLLLLARFAWQIRRLRTHSRKLLLPQSIRETIDHLPCGICFSTPRGRPILVNHKMNDLVYRLTGHTIMNANITWDELRRLEPANGRTKLENLWLNSDNTSDDADERLLFMQIDGYIWKFSKESLADGDSTGSSFAQLEASEISELYRNTEKLYEINERLVKQHKRQQDLLENIVEINHEKETLHAKMKIHDDLGRSILTTKQHLSNKAFPEGVPYLVEIWSNTIRGLTDFTQTGPRPDTSPETELRRAAEMIGCRINIVGDRPAERKSVLLFFAAVREALTNAVKHAHADQLNVTITPTGQGYHLEISDNGTADASSVTEGSGLGNLRQKLEQEGATLEVKCEDGVVIIADLPA